MHITFEILSFLLLPILLARGEIQWNEDCNFEQSIDLGASFYFRSPNYPAQYQPETNCKLKAATNWANNQLELKCNIDIPKDKKGCINHRMVVITFVDSVENPKSTRVYCGKREFTETILDPKKYAQMYVEFTSNGNKTGKFACTVSNKGVK
ncbi:uncharacterized protein [Drosophila pseudoobscura]|uniref:CUB domain-containing protein n=1 Tax=Drosophila pseudoobscura pseudoobscura TaxID=46245 RepID=A0A6I8VXZ0_DROPS|nr:uncharacterized protein LOC117184041 [Drosophila pseudoobscura]